MSNESVLPELLRPHLSLDHHLRGGLLQRSGPAPLPAGLGQELHHVEGVRLHHLLRGRRLLHLVRRLLQRNNEEAKKGGIGGGVND